MTKAERIYFKTRYECKKHIENWGFEENAGFHSVIYGENETVCKRTLNEIKKHLERAKRMVIVDLKLGVLTHEEAKNEAQILKMVENTINNTVR